MRLRRSGGRFLMVTTANGEINGRGKGMYDEIVRYYDLIHDGLTADRDFILELAKECDGPVLELGCGSGRLLLPLAQAGYTAVGVDSSEEMLAQARQRFAVPNLGYQPRLILGDMSTLELSQRFGLVVIPYNTFMHLSTPQMRATLRRVREWLGGNGRLANGGRLFIDLINPLPFQNLADEETFTPETTLFDAENNREIVQSSRFHVDEAAQLLHVTWVFESGKTENKPLSSSTFLQSYHYLFPHQIEMMLKQAGLRLKKLLGDYDGSPFSEESERLLILATGGD